jgi:hypothetical protein
LTSSCNDTLMTLFSISRRPNPKGNDVGNIHELYLGYYIH